MTQHYVGTKIIEAWPAADLDGTPGYGVKYADGYTSWSPAEAFEAAYLPLGHIGNHPPHVQRMIAEQAQLADRLKKLGEFLVTDVFFGLPELEQEALAYQHGGMSAYQLALSGRIARATGVVPGEQHG